MFLKNAGDWPAVGAEHAGAFGADRPAATMIVAGLLDPRMLIELEIVAQLED
jgi:enamine deaminase RidA (YjgF/YER057c/UK114 family)